MKKFIKWFYLVLTVYPFALSLAMVRAGSDFASGVRDVFTTFRFAPLANLISTVGDELHMQFASPASNACSWVVFVIFVYLCTYFVTFLPVMCFNAFGNRGDKE